MGKTGASAPRRRLTPGAGRICFDFPPRRVLVAGGCHGIGEAIVDAYLHAGCKVAVFDTDKDKGSAMARDKGIRFYPIDCSDHTPSPSRPIPPYPAPYRPIPPHSAPSFPTSGQNIATAIPSPPTTPVASSSSFPPKKRILPPPPNLIPHQTPRLILLPPLNLVLSPVLFSEHCSRLKICLLLASPPTSCASFRRRRIPPPISPQQKLISIQQKMRLTAASSLASSFSPFPLPPSSAASTSPPPKASQSSYRCWEQR